MKVGDAVKVTDGIRVAVLVEVTDGNADAVCNLAALEVCATKVPRSLSEIITSCCKVGAAEAGIKQDNENTRRIFDKRNILELFFFTFTPTPVIVSNYFST